MLRRVALLPFVSFVAAGIVLAAVARPNPAQATEHQQVWLRFVDAQKHPVGGVEVKLRVQDRREPLGRSTADGALVIDVPWTWPEEEHGFEAIAEARGFQLEIVSGKMLRGVDLDLGDIELKPGASATGRVIDRDKKPVAGATVRAIPTRPDGRTMKKGALVATTDEQGRYELLGLTPGKVRMWARHERTRWKNLPELEVKAGDALHDLDFMVDALPDDQVVSGTVVDPSGQPIAGAELRTLIKEPDGPSMLPAKATADEKGHFDLYLPDQPAEAFWIDVEDPKARFGEISYADAVPGDRALRIVLPAVQTIALEVKDASGKPIEEFGWAVRFQRARGGTQEDAADAHHPGGVADLRAPSRTFSLTVHSRLYSPKDFGPYDPKSLPPKITVALEHLPSIAGRVTAGGKPVPGAFVQVIKPEAHALSGTAIEGYAKLVTPLRGLNAIADEQGRFEIPVTASAGEVHVRGWARGWCEGVATGFKSGAHDVVVELGTGGTLEGKVLLPNGADPTGLFVEVYRDRTSAEYGTNKTQRMRTPVTADDTYRIEHIAPGPWLVRLVFPPARRSVDTEALGLPMLCTLESDKTVHLDIDVRARKACVLLGTLQVNGKPSRQGGVRLYTLTTPPLVVDASEIDNDGTFRFAAGEPGRYRLVWTGGANQFSRKTVTQAIELAPGENHWQPNLEETQWNGRVIDLDAK